MDVRTKIKLEELADTLRKLADNCEKKSRGCCDAREGEDTPLAVSLCFIDGEVKGGMAINCDATPLNMLDVVSRQIECQQFLVLQIENKILTTPKAAKPPILESVKPDEVDNFDDLSDEELADDLANDPIIIPAETPEQTHRRKLDERKERDRLYRERKKEECSTKKQPPTRGRGRPPKLATLQPRRGRPPKLQAVSGKQKPRKAVSVARGKKKRR